MPKVGKDVGLGGIAFPPSLPPPPYPSSCSLCLHDARNKAYFRWIFSRHLCFEFGRELRCVRMRGFSTSPKRIREEWSGRLCKGNSFFFCVRFAKRCAFTSLFMIFSSLGLLEIWFVRFMIHVYSIERDFFHFIPQGLQKVRIYQFVCRIPCPFC